MPHVITVIEIANVVGCLSTHSTQFLLVANFGIIHPAPSSPPQSCSKLLTTCVLLLICNDMAAATVGMCECVRKCVRALSNYCYLSFCFKTFIVVIFVIYAGSGNNSCCCFAAAASTVCLWLVLSPTSTAIEISFFFVFVQFSSSCFINFCNNLLTIQNVVATLHFCWGISYIS